MRFLAKAIRCQWAFTYLHKDGKLAIGRDAAGVRGGVGLVVDRVRLPARPRYADTAPQRSQVYLRNAHSTFRSLEVQDCVAGTITDRYESLYSLLHLGLTVAYR